MRSLYLIITDSSQEATKTFKTKLIWSSIDFNQLSVILCSEISLQSPDLWKIRWLSVFVA